METKIQNYHTCYVDRANSKPMLVAVRKKQLRIIMKSDAWLRRGIVSEDKDRSECRQPRGS